MRLKSAAEYLDMAPCTIRELVKRQELSYISSGEHTSAWRFCLEDLDAWIEDHRIGQK